MRGYPRVLVGVAILAMLPTVWGQVGPSGRSGPPGLEDFESDVNHDGIPDGWYNLRDARLAEGGVVGAGHALRFEVQRPGRPARISRAFGVDGREVGALVVGLWVRLEEVRTGERMGEDPGLLVNFNDADLRTTGRATMDFRPGEVGSRWVRLARRIPVPPQTQDAILTVGLFGATGILEIDGLTIDVEPAGGEATKDLVLNGNFELGDPSPDGWVLADGARRNFPGSGSAAALELTRAGATASTVLGLPVDRFGWLQFSATVLASGLSRTGVVARFFFLDEEGQVLPQQPSGALIARWVGSFTWRSAKAAVPVPQGAQVAVLQFDQLDPRGTFKVDDVRVTASPDPEAGSWTPYSISNDTAGWTPYQPADEIAAGTALDASGLLDAPAGRHGFVTVKDGHLAFSQGGRARFFGVVLLPPIMYPGPTRADALADRLARSGVNLVRLVDLDLPLGPGQGLIDDARDDTQHLDPKALDRLDHLIAALKSRGIYVALELQGARKFREGDQVADARDLPVGGGSAAAFDPRIRKLAIAFAENLLSHVNPETNLALRDDPALAWVTLTGELSLFDQLSPGSALPPEQAARLAALARSSPVGTGRRFWQATESAQWISEAQALRQSGLKVPIAGSAHWRREPEFVAAQAAEGLDLIDDRLFWLPPPLGHPQRLTLLRGGASGLVGEVVQKRKADRAFVIGQWAGHTNGAWALPYEGADLVLMAAFARVEDWDALVRRGISSYPESWGSAATGTGGGQDIFPVPESLNGNPQVFALLPHAASLMLRDRSATPAEPHPAPRSGRRPREVAGPPGWEPQAARLVVDTPHTKGVAGWSARQPADLEDLRIEPRSTYSVVMASSLGPEPIARASRLLVTAVAQVEPTGLRFVDTWQTAVADPGRPPLLVEPVRARLLWRRPGKMTAYPLDEAGRRGEPVVLERTEEGAWLDLDGRLGHLHWELAVE